MVSSKAIPAFVDIYHAPAVVSAGLTIYTAYLHPDPWPYNLGHQKRRSERRGLSATIKWHTLFAHNQQEAKSKLLWQIGIIMHYWKRMHMSDTLQSCISLACAHQVSEPSLAACPQKQGRLLWQCDESPDSSMRVCRCMHLRAWSHVSNGQKLDECNCATAHSSFAVHFHE